MKDVLFMLCLEGYRIKMYLPSLPLFGFQYRPNVIFWLFGLIILFDLIG